MRILVLGGSVFLGRAVVTEALRRGHQVTVFNRGLSGADPEGAEAVRGDLTSAADLARLADGRRWDAVVDTGGQHPRTVGACARALSERAGTYVLVSPVPDGDTELSGGERAVEESFGGDAVILHAVPHIGPHESTGRLPWWLERFARGGRVLLPGSPDRPVRLIDARDLAVFALDRAVAGDAGRYLAAGPAEPATLGALFAACARAAGSGAEAVWADDGFLLAAGVAPGSGLPLWVPGGDPGPAGVRAASAAKAYAAGLRCRPLADSVADTMAWLTARGPAAPAGAPPGISPAREAELLAAWDRRAAAATG